MSIEETTLPVVVLPSLDIPALELRAKQAYEQNRARECLRLANELLAVSPDNETAHTLQSAISADIDLILSEVRALIEERQTGSQLGRLSAAQVMLAKVMQIAPDHKGANALLQATKALSKDLQPERQAVPVRPEMPFTAAYSA